MLSVSENENSTLVARNLDCRVSTDRTWRTFDLQLHHGSAAHHHWICRPCLRNSYTGDGSDSEAAVQAAPRPLRWISLVGRGADYSRVHNS